MSLILAKIELESSLNDGVCDFVFSILGGLGFIPIDYKKSISIRLRLKFFYYSCFGFCTSLKALSQSTSIFLSLDAVLYWKGEALILVEAINFCTI